MMIVIVNVNGLIMGIIYGWYSASTHTAALREHPGNESQQGTGAGQPRPYR